MGNRWFRPVVGVDILEVIPGAAKDAATLRVIGDTRAEVWSRVYEPFH